MCLASHYTFSFSFYFSSREGKMGDLIMAKNNNKKIKNKL
jgi:hypothetical protein